MQNINSFLSDFVRVFGYITLSRGYDVQEVPPPKMYILRPS